MERRKQNRRQETGSASIVLAVLSCALFALGEVSAQDVAGTAAREVVKRQNQVTAAQTLFAAGSQALADRSFGEAMDNFKAAFETMPPVPAVEAQRRAFFKRYQSTALTFAEIKISEARWAEAKQTLEEVVRLADDNQMPDALIDPRIPQILDDLANRDERFNQAISPAHIERVNEVESKLILAHGYLELGDYDRAERSYHQVLAIDSYNSAARRGLEKVEQYRMNYFDAARDQNRAKMLSEIAAGWETPVPSVNPGAGVVDNLPGIDSGGSLAIENKLESIRIPQVELIDSPLRDVVDYLVLKSQELDTSATDPSQRGVNIVIDGSNSPTGDDPADRVVSVRLTNVPLSAVLKYVTQQVGMKYRVDNFAVSIVPLSDSATTGLVTRSYAVPPGFISASGPAGGGNAGPVDPFANPEPAGAGIPIKRVSAQEFLQNSGIVFDGEASARFIASTSTLVVRNTPEQLLAIENLIQTSRENGGKMVEIRVKLLSVEDVELNQLGLDFLLGTSNLGGGTPRVFGGGGTTGNAVNPATPADFPFVLPGGQPVGLNPVTSGLRTGNIPSGVSIDDLINFGGAAPAGAAPGIFSVAGVFTDPQFQAVLRAVSQLKGTDTMDDTYVLAKPGQRARIQRVREFIYPTEYDPPEIPTSVGVSGAGVFPVTPATPTAFEMREVGTIVEVEPTVSADNLSINVNVLTDFTDFSGFINYGSPISTISPTAANAANSLVLSDNRILMPVFDAVKEMTNVTVWDGQTIAIGGYHGQAINSTRDKVPGIGDLPVVGSAFRSKTDRSTKQAVLLFVTVRLVDPGGVPINAPTEDPDLSYRNEPLPPRPGIGRPGGAPAAALPAAVYPAK